MALIGGMNISFFGIFVLFPLFRTKSIDQRTNAKNRQLTFVLVFLFLNLVNCKKISRNHRKICARVKESRRKVKMWWDIFETWNFKDFQITKQNPSTNFNYQYIRGRGELRVRNPDYPSKVYLRQKITLVAFQKITIFSNWANNLILGLRNLFFFFNSSQIINNKLGKH